MITTLGVLIGEADKPSSNSSLISLAILALADFRKMPVVLGPYRKRYNNSSRTALGTGSSSEHNWLRGIPKSLGTSGEQTQL